MNLRFYFSSCHNLIQVVIARGFHLFPFRTEKLSLVTPMVLRNSGRVGSRHFQRSPSGRNTRRALLFWILSEFKHISSTYFKSSVLLKKKRPDNLLQYYFSVSFSASFSFNFILFPSVLFKIPYFAKTKYPFKIELLFQNGKVGSVIIYFLLLYMYLIINLLLFLLEFWHAFGIIHCKYYNNKYLKD